MGWQTRQELCLLYKFCNCLWLNSIYTIYINERMGLTVYLQKFTHIVLHIYCYIDILFSQLQDSGELIMPGKYKNEYKN